MLRVFIWACIIAVCFAQRAEQLLAQNPCSSKTTCSECVRTASCAWCYAAVFNGPRCFNPAIEGGTAGCDEAYVHNPDNQLSIDPRYNRELSRGKFYQKVSLTAHHFTVITRNLFCLSLIFHNKCFYYSEKSYGYWFIFV